MAALYIGSEAELVISLLPDLEALGGLTYIDHEAAHTRAQLCTSQLDWLGSVQIWGHHGKQGNMGYVRNGDMQEWK